MGSLISSKKNTENPRDKDPKKDNTSKYKFLNQIQN
jgi:hypothetical protein